MTKKTTASAAQIIDVSFKATLESKYLAYALSTITSRSLPDVRDGLKPVHRRLLYAMLQLKLDPKSGYKKCARVVGDVIGKYHPHGDTAVYDAMVRLAQGFAVRYPLVEGQGNFGSIDGDNAAAMRYTEARLTDAAMALMEALDENTVDFRPTYDGEDAEPIVMPAAFPNLLANGSEGIAVGMATSIPPHNVGEICDALLYVIAHPDADAQKLIKKMPGPDFPTGGVIVEHAENIVNAYKTGRGAIRIRAKWQREDLSHGLYQIIITEIPYQVQKSKLIERMAELFKNKKLPLMGNIRDESAEDIRIVIEPKSRSVDAEMLMESLFRATDLETRFNLNLNVLNARGVPEVMGLNGLLKAFLEHRHEVLIRRSKYRLEKIAARLNLLEGFLICFLNLDEVIRIIREEDEPKQVMMKKFKLNEEQVEAILNMRLRSLRRLEEMEIKREHKELSGEQKALKALLKDEAQRWEHISEEIKAIKKQFGSGELGKRRTELADAPEVKEISIEAFVEREPITVLCSKMGWIRALKGHAVDANEVKYKEGDEAAFELKTYTTDKILMFATNGRFYTITGDKIPRGKKDGEPIRLLVDMEQNDELVAVFTPETGAKLLLATSAGKGFVVEADEVYAQTRAGKHIISPTEGARATHCVLVDGDHVAVIGENRKLLVFAVSQIPPMKKGQGVQLQKYKDGGLSDIKTFLLKDGLSYAYGSGTRVEADVRSWLGNRADAGKLPPQGFSRENRF